jgi:20S proteasome subunit beta 6
LTEGLTWALLLCRTCVAVAGDDYCIVAASTRMSTGFQILKRDASMILKLCALLPVTTGPSLLAC